MLHINSFEDFDWLYNKILTRCSSSYRRKLCHYITTSNDFFVLNSYILIDTIAENFKYNYNNLAKYNNYFSNSFEDILQNGSIYASDVLSGFSFRLPRRIQLLTNIQGVPFQQKELCLTYPEY